MSALIRAPAMRVTKDSSAVRVRLQHITSVSYAGHFLAQWDTFCYMLAAVFHGRTELVILLWHHETFSTKMHTYLHRLTLLTNHTSYKLVCVSCLQKGFC